MCGVNCDCVVFANVSGNVYMVAVCVSMCECMFVNVRVCMVRMLCLYVFLAMFVW